ncbi:hypothetical protein K432DRAFT_430072 [Lepidopterella palustris CBS 459.81]|uniref:Uncharacterized protein n=1 Tax=Lepidopterella palustris CBS 459.81 TaxID=1314670 RepID=A0A8E2J9J4_9PEZI|nr:hypothetical protein K432DRAFT_430072 [Lepidopterella palustris CBS 459.81]
MVWRVLLIALWIAVARGTNCYYPNGDLSPSTNDFPCSTIEGAACCPLNWQCLSNGLCYLENENYYGRYGCTDQTWNSPYCPRDLCTHDLTAAGDEAVLQCSNHNNQYCCDGDRVHVHCCTDSNIEYFDLAQGIAYASIGSGSTPTSAPVINSNANPPSSAAPSAAAPSSAAPSSAAPSSAAPSSAAPSSAAPSSAAPSSAAPSSDPPSSAPVAASSSPNQDSPSIAAASSSATPTSFSAASSTSKSYQTFTASPVSTSVHASHSNSFTTAVIATTTTPSPAPSPRPAAKAKDPNVGVIVGLSVGIPVAFALFAISLGYKWRQKRLLQ